MLHVTCWVLLVDRLDVVVKDVAHYVYGYWLLPPGTDIEAFMDAGHISHARVAFCIDWGILQPDLEVVEYKTVFLALSDPMGVGLSNTMPKLSPADVRHYVGKCCASLKLPEVGHE